MPTSKPFLNKDLLLDYLSQSGVIEAQKALKEISSEFSILINNKIKRNLKKVNETYEKALPLNISALELEEKNLPKWIKNDIENVRLVEASKQTLIMPDGRKYNINNTLNHLSGSEWTYFINSVINTNYKTSGPDSYAHHIRKVHPSPKPPQLMKNIIEFFTKENEIVLDYFMGVGGSLLGASLCNRRSVGIDLNQTYLDAYKKAAQYLNVSLGNTICGNSMQILADEKQMKRFLGDEKVGLILIDPPYANMMSKKKTGADISIYGNVATPFTQNAADLGNLTRSEFLLRLKKSVILASEYLKNKGYIVIFIKDLQPHKKELNLLHAEIISSINEISNIEYKGLKIWADQSAKLFPYGYPFAFVANQIHQYILVFRKI